LLGHHDAVVLYFTRSFLLPSLRRTRAIATEENPSDFLKDRRSIKDMGMKECPRALNVKKVDRETGLAAWVCALSLRKSVSPDPFVCPYFEQQA